MPDLPSTLSATRRHALLALGASLTARRQGAADPDRVLLCSCSRFNAIERRRLALLDGTGRVEDDDARDAALMPLDAEQRPVLDAICEARATTLAGHQARAASYALWDGGELLWRAEKNRFLEDRLLAALLRDLIGETPR